MRRRPGRVKDDSWEAARQGLGKPTRRCIAKDAPFLTEAGDSKNHRKGASLRNRRPLLTYPWAWEVKATKGYVAKEAPPWAFLNPERVYRQGGQNQLCERSTETDVF